MPVKPHILNGARTRRIVKAITDATKTIYFEAETHNDGDIPVTQIRRRGPSDPWVDYTHDRLKGILSAVPGIDKVRADGVNKVTVIWHPTTERA